MKEELDEYQDERNISQADAVRRLVRIGLDREKRATPDGGEVMSRLDAHGAALEELQQQQVARHRRQTALLIAGVAYIATTIATGVSSVWWGVIGTALLVGLFATLEVYR